MSTHCTKDFQKFPSHVCLCEFEANLDYTVNSKIARAIQGNLVLERKRKKKKKRKFENSNDMFLFMYSGYISVLECAHSGPRESSRG